MKLTLFHALVAAVCAVGAVVAVFQHRFMFAALFALSGNQEVILAMLADTRSIYREILKKYGGRHNDRN